MCSKIAPGACGPHGRGYSDSHGVARRYQTVVQEYRPPAFTKGSKLHRSMRSAPIPSHELAFGALIEGLEIGLERSDEHRLRHIRVIRPAHLVETRKPPYSGFD
jgi:hypothetical protein